MSPVRIAILGGAMVAALSAAFVVRGIATGKERAPVPVAVVEKPTLRVLVAARDLSIGERLAETDMTWQPWPAEGINPAYTITGGPPPTTPTQAGKIAKAASGVAAAMSGSDKVPMQAFLGAAVRDPVAKGEPIMAVKLVKAGDAGVMAVSLTPGFRAMAVPLTAESAAGGFILPGDHVDVVQSRAVEGPGMKGFTSTTVLRNVKILAIDQSLRPTAKQGAAPAPALVGATGTLEVTPAQAELLAMAKSQGQLTLVLRSYADSDGPSSSGSLQGAVSAEGAAASQTVRVFRDGKPTDVTVAR